MDLKLTMSRLFLFSRSLVRCPIICSQQQLSSNQSSRQPMVSIPPRPKKPITPWFMFVRDRKDDLLQRQKMSAAELTVALSKEWKSVDKSNYQTQYSRLHQEYLSAKLDYEKSLTPEQKQQLQNIDKNRVDQKALRDLRRTKPPKFPRNSANFYFAEKSSDPYLRERLGAQSQSEVLSKVFKEYAGLTNDQKEKYVKMQENDRERFRHEFTSWYESVMSDKTVSRLARAKADAMRTRFKLLSYI